MFKIGQEIFFYRDEECPYFEGIIISEENKTIYLEKDFLYYNVKWKIGGTSGVETKHIFATKEEWQIFYNKILEEQKIKNERIEYQTYLILKEKYENK